tara:strand:- start:136 stop:927 length:792 start_codon:yes stop_codon:yes gene_type:complete
MNESNLFLQQLYGREDARSLWYKGQISIDNFLNHPQVKKQIEHYKSILPDNQDCKILDIGVGEGWFAAICSHLGYKNIEMADYGCSSKFLDIANGIEEIKSIHNVDSTIQDLMAKNEFINKYDFIHMSHVIEHIPKHDLINTMDTLNAALCEGGVLFLRCPNMLGPLPMMSLYVTMGHEYGFIPSNLKQLFLGTNFTDIKFHTFEYKPKNLKNVLGAILRKVYILNAQLKYRAFEGYIAPTFHPELIASAKKCQDKDRLTIRN